MCTHLIERDQSLRDSAPCLSCAATPPEGHQTGARKRCAPGNTILSQPYHRRALTDRLNREGSQLAASLEVEPGPTPAGKTLPHSYHETRFRRKRGTSLFIGESGSIVGCTCRIGSPLKYRGESVNTLGSKHSLQRQEVFMRFSGSPMAHHHRGGTYHYSYTV